MPSRPANGSTTPADRHVAGVQPDHRRLLQVPLELSDADPGEGRRSQQPVDRDVAGARGYAIVDETYTFAQDSFSRKRVHVLTSVNYTRMSAEDKAKEPASTRRTDGDYALSYIQRVGNGRMFYEAFGHDESLYCLADVRRPHARRNPVRPRRSEGRRQSEREVAHPTSIRLRGTAWWQAVPRFVVYVASRRLLNR